MTDFRIEKTIHLAAPISRVWDFLTKAELIAQWFSTPDADLTKGAGFRLAERDTQEVLCWGKVLDMQPPNFMVWDFTVGPAGGHISRVEWHLSESPGGTALTLKHSDLPQSSEEFDLLLALDKGWHGFLNALYPAIAPPDYRATIQVTASADQARTALFNEMPLWWSDRVEQTETGATIRFNNSHVSFHFDGPDGLAWRCTDANMIIEDVEDTTEWLGTRLLWTITPTDSGSEITLQHEGLNETLACLDVCTRGWEHYFENSLKAHLSGEPPSPQTHENT